MWILWEKSRLAIACLFAGRSAVMLCVGVVEGAAGSVFTCIYRVPSWIVG